MDKKKQITLTIKEWEYIHDWGTTHGGRDYTEMDEPFLEDYIKTEMAFEKLKKKLFG